MDLPKLPGETFIVWAKPNAQQNEYVGYHSGRQAFEFRIAAIAKDNYANEELLNFLKNDFGLVCEIISGCTAKRKRLKIL
jgi:uncharacterized protein (TIGR00251 family)